MSELTPPVAATSSEGDVEDYVYDVFYHRPSQDSYEPGSSSNVAKL